MYRSRIAGQLVSLRADVHGVDAVRQAVVLSVFHANHIVDGHQKTVSRPANTVLLVHQICRQPDGLNRILYTVL